MLSNRAFRSVKNILAFGCYLKIFPYNWDSDKCRLYPITKWHEKLAHFFHMSMSYALTLFSLIRFIESFAVGKYEPERALPPRVSAMNILWGLAYLLTSITFLQFSVNRDDIRYFGNLLIGHIQKQISKKKPKKNKLLRREKKVGKGIENWISETVIISGFMLIINPPCHSIMMIDTPCAPHFSSSIWLSCSHYEEDSHPFVHKISFIFLETYNALLMFLTWTFNWTFIYLGLGWILISLKKLRSFLKENRMAYSDSCSTLHKKYQKIRVIVTLINQSFSSYLKYFPVILLGIVAYLIYSCIRFYGVSWRQYLMFPSCAFRCIFESFTPLSLAGDVHHECSQLQKEWKMQVQNFSNPSSSSRIKIDLKSYFLSKKDDAEEDENKIFSLDRVMPSINIEGKLFRTLRKSSPVFSCSAGGMYTFENSIVLITVSNCLLLTLNLLLIK